MTMNPKEGDIYLYPDKSGCAIVLSDPANPVLNIRYNNSDILLLSNTSWSDVDKYVYAGNIVDLMQTLHTKITEE